MEKLEALRRYFGYTAFHEGQERLIDAILAGRDALGVMPTGGGKSLCYQLPALLRPGAAIVVSPLISLMKDQVMQLKAAGIPAAFLNSSLTPEQMRLVYRRIYEGAYQIVYVAPERLEAPGFLAAAKSIRISLLAVDEAHCISQWGQDFRPSYLRISDFLAALPVRPPVAAFTATATTRVRNDIREQLMLRDPETVVTGFDRPNLYFEVQHPAKKDEALLRLLNARREKSGIVYCATRNGVESVCAMLKLHGYAATRYHAGLDDEERQRNQEDFICDRSPVMVATNAFGMGIDKSNVSFIIHYNMPKSLEAYYQEAGRAGRDGSAAECFLLYAPGDVQTAKFLIQSAAENEALSEEDVQINMREDLRRLDAMVGYCKTDGCLRGRILDYFGQQHEAHCGNCGNCMGEYELRDITREAQMILSCVMRIRSQLRYSVGAALVMQTLRGSRSARVLQLHLDELPTYGLLQGMPQETLRLYLDALLAQKLLRRDPEHETLALTQEARAVLFDGRPIFCNVRKEAPPEKEAVPDERLLRRLKALRLRLAQQAGIPAFMVFSNATLEDMAAKAPRTMTAFLDVSGVGEAKAERYGDAFLALIREAMPES